MLNVESGVLLGVAHLLGVLVGGDGLPPVLVLLQVEAAGGGDLVFVHAELEVADLILQVLLVRVARA